MTSRDAYASNRAQDILVENDFFDSSAFKELSLLYEGFSIRMQSLEQMLFLAPKELLDEMENERQFMNFFSEHLKEFLFQKTTPLIRIFSKKEGDGAKLFSTPLEIGSILKNRLWEVIPSIVMTSATLTIHSEFTYISKILSLDSFEFERLKTDFDYAKQALLYIPAEL